MRVISIVAEHSTTLPIYTRLLGYQRRIMSIPNTKHNSESWFTLERTVYIVHVQWNVL
jgi:hypothetical protein